MSLLARPLTYEDLKAMPADGNRYEIVDGELIVSAAPNRKHQRWSYILTRWVGEVVDEGGLGEVYAAPVDVQLLADRPQLIVQPDLIFIRRERLHIFGSDLVVGAPDLVIEILSPSTRTLDLTRKAQLYAEAGVVEYGVADPDEPSFHLYALGDGEYREIAAEAGRVRSAVVAGLVIELGALFDVLG